MSATSAYSLQTLANGITFAQQQMPHARTVFVGAYVPAGISFEDRTNNGVSHLLEHLHLATTRTYSTRQSLATAIDSVPGFFSAHTTLDHICFWFETSPAFVPRVGNLLAEILEQRRFGDELIESERRLVIAEVRDRGHESVDQVVRAICRRNGRPMHIAGDRRSLGRLRADAIDNFDRMVFRPDQILIVVAGCVDRIDPSSLTLPLEKLHKAEHSEGLKQAVELLGFPIISPMNPRQYSGDLLVGACLQRPLTATEQVSLNLIDYALNASSGQLSHDLRYSKVSSYYSGGEQFEFLTANVIYFHSRTTSGQVMRQLTLILDAIDRIRQERIDSDWFELARAQQRFVIDHYCLFPMYVGSVLGEELMRKDTRLPRLFADQLNALSAIECRDVAQTARDVFTKNNMFVLTGARSGWLRRRRIEKALDRVA